MKFLFFPNRALLLVPVFAIIGAANNQREWLGALVGGAIGLFFAMMLMGLLPAKIVNWMFPEKEE